jgi:hypothetical protein
MLISINFSLFIAMVIALVFVAIIRFSIYKSSQINSTNLMIVLIVFLVSFLVKALYLKKMSDFEKYIYDGEIPL